MASTRNKTIIKKELVKYITSLGLKVNTLTKARGNKGFFKENRIDVSRNLDDAACIKTLIHEYAHFVNYRLDKKIKSLEVIFKSDDKILHDELLSVTGYVDENSQCRTLYIEREKLKKVIKDLTTEIRKSYPKFKPNEPLKEFRRYARWSDAKYLEKYDRVKIHSWFSEKIYSISTVKKDIPDLPQVFIDYIKLKSKIRQRTKITRRISKLNRYYSEPCELFARFVEGLYLNADKIKYMAPNAYGNFMELYKKDYYYGLKRVFSIAGTELT
ncbi:MAG: hypothetical protein LUB59_05755 [Candidatus Gastranaerophilales bacterium]|nr:hypothetical protein [Candidatus Gastranaerophilales bacterium]